MIHLQTAGSFLRICGRNGLEEGYDGIFKSLPEEKKNELMGRKQAFAIAAGIEI